MRNSKETICGELLYEFMVHEKGFKISGRWNNHEKKKLLNDFAVMRQLIQLIELEIDVSFGEIKKRDCLIFEKCRCLCRKCTTEKRL